MIRHIRLEFGPDQSGHSDHKLVQYGSGLKYKLGSRDFDPGNRNDVNDLVDELSRLDDFKDVDRRNLTRQIERLRKEDLDRPQHLKI